MQTRTRVALSAAGVFACAGFLAAWQEESAVAGHVVRPKRVDATPERVRSLRVPPGLRVSVWADGLGKPRMLAAAEDGSVYVTRREPGDLWLLRDADGDGRAEVKRKLIEKPDLHGVALAGSDIYLVTIKEAFRAARLADGGVGDLATIARDLPDAGQHPNRTLAVGPDGWLYLSVGSTCNACREPNPEAATLLRMKTDGSGREVYASGLRNTIGFAWHPATGALWGADHGIDWLGDDEQKEELNLIEEGQRYGWPYAYADGRINPAIEPPPGSSKEEWARASRPPLLLHTAHSAPMQLVFNRGERFPQAYQEGAFVALHGSWNRKPPSGYEVVFVRFGPDGRPQAIEPFLSGFLVAGNPPQQFGRPCGLAQLPDGSLLVSDDSNGLVYRVDSAPR